MDALYANHGTIPGASNDGSGMLLFPSTTIIVMFRKKRHSKFVFYMQINYLCTRICENKDVVSVKMDLKKHRIVYLDWSKTICIFLMVVGHWTSNELLLRYIYSFHMPALFVISGYLYRPHSWIKTVISFCVPVIFCSFINLFKTHSAIREKGLFLHNLLAIFDVDALWQSVEIVVPSSLQVALPSET